MPLLDRFRRRPRPGSPWDGPAAWSTDSPHDVPTPGFYALAEGGREFRLPLVRLVTDGNGGYSVAAPTDPAQAVVARRVVAFEAEAHGDAGVGA